jgi:hypothetical protein
MSRPQRIKNIYHIARKQAGGFSNPSFDIDYLNIIEVIFLTMPKRMLKEYKHV